MVDEMDPVAIQSDESFNVLCVSLGLHHTKNELEMVDLVFAETKKLRAKSEGLMMECLTELQDVRQAYNNELIAVKTEIGQQMESLQCELAKKSDELKNASVENQQQYIIKEKFKNFLNLMSDRKLHFFFIISIYFHSMQNSLFVCRSKIISNFLLHRDSYV